MPSHTTTEVDAVLSKRAHHLRTLIEQPRPKSELETVVECSRSTLSRSLRELADVGLAQYENGIWKPTLLGRHSCEIRGDYQSRLTDLSAASTLLENLPNDSPLSSTFLMDAEVHRAKSTMPDAVLQTLLDLAERGTEVCVVTPTLMTGFARQMYDRVTNSEIGTLEIVFTRNQLEQIRTTFPAFVTKLMECSDIHLFCSPIPFSYGLWVVDSICAAVVIFTDRGIRGVIVNNSDSSIEWANTQYDEVKQEAELIENICERVPAPLS